MGEENGDLCLQDNKLVESRADLSNFKIEGSVDSEKISNEVRGMF